MINGLVDDLQGESLQQRCKSDSGMFGLLAQLWIREIDLPRLNALAADELRQLYVEAGGFVPSVVGPEAIDRLAIEYCACFLGPKNHLPPYQSVVVSSKFQAECIDSMNTYVDVMGRLDKDFGQKEFGQKIMLDHAGVQLKIGQIIASAICDAQPDDLTPLVDLQRCFHGDHLAWIGEYCRVAAIRSGSEFYTALFRLTASFLDERASGI